MRTPRVQELGIAHGGAAVGAIVKDHLEVTLKDPADDAWLLAAAAAVAQVDARHGVLASVDAVVGDVEVRHGRRLLALANEMILRAQRATTISAVSGQQIVRSVDGSGEVGAVRWERGGGSQPSSRLKLCAQRRVRQRGIGMRGGAMGSKRAS